MHSFGYSIHFSTQPTKHQSSSRVSVQQEWLRSESDQRSLDREGCKVCDSIFLCLHRSDILGKYQQHMYLDANDRASCQKRRKHHTLEQYNTYHRRIASFPIPPRNCLWFQGTGDQRRCKRKVTSNNRLRTFVSSRG